VSGADDDDVEVLCGGAHKLHFITFEQEFEITRY
jgi:hypothetical protein